MQLLIDYSSLLYRAYHSLPDSIPMKGVYGLLNMLARVLADRRPDRLALAVDDDWLPAFRSEALPMYKAQRVSDEPDPVLEHEKLGRQVLQALGFCVVGSDGFEAEDVIATLAARATEPVEILSGDRDLFALVRDPLVKVLYPLRGTSELWEVDEEQIRTKYKIPGRAYLDYALLRGDPSDNLPGVKGIGEKTAARLISEHGSLEALLSAPNLAPAVRKKLDAARDYLVAARRAVPPMVDVPLEEVCLDLPTAFADPEAVARFAELYKLDGALGRVRQALDAFSGVGPRGA